MTQGAKRGATLGSQSDPNLVFCGQCNELLIGRSLSMAADTRTVVLETSVGDITIELYWNHAPRTCRVRASRISLRASLISRAQNIWELAKRGYYNGTVFHRVIKNFMIQGGPIFFRLDLALS
jgi:hypothetical protein